MFDWKQLFDTVLNAFSGPSTSKSGGGIYIFSNITISFGDFTIGTGLVFAATILGLCYIYGPAKEIPLPQTPAIDIPSPLKIEAPASPIRELGHAPIVYYTPDQVNFTTEPLERKSRKVIGEEFSTRYFRSSAEDAICEPPPLTVPVELDDIYVHQFIRSGINHWQCWRRDRTPFAEGEHCWVEVKEKKAHFTDSKGDVRLLTISAQGKPYTKKVEARGAT